MYIQLSMMIYQHVYIGMILACYIRIGLTLFYNIINLATQSDIKPW